MSSQNPNYNWPDIKVLINTLLDSQVRGQMKCTIHSTKGDLHVYPIGRFNHETREKNSARIEILTEMKHKLGRVHERTLRLKTVVLHLGSTMASGHFITYKWDHERQGYWYFTDGSYKPQFLTEVQAQAGLQQSSYVVIYEDITEDS